MPVLREEVPEAAIADWRVATLRCIGLHEGCAKLLARSLYNFLEPLISSTVQPADLNRLKAQVDQLCEDTCMFRQLKRMSKEGYRCQVVPRGTLLKDSESFAEPYGVENGNEAGDSVAFTLHGALTKLSNRGGRQMVLEKAHVVMKAK